MSRLRWSIMAFGLVVFVAWSFEVARARDKDPNQPKSAAGGQPAGIAPVGKGAGANPGGQAPLQGAQKQITPTAPRDAGKSPGTSLPPFQPNKGSVQPNTGSGNVQGGKPAGGSGVPGNIGGLPGSGGAGRGTTVNPQGATGRSQSDINSGAGINPGSGKSGGSPLLGGQKIEVAKPSGGLGPAPTGVGKVGNPLGGQGVNASKAIDSPTRTSVGVIPHGKLPVGKSKISVRSGRNSP